MDQNCSFGHHALISVKVWRTVLKATFLKLILRHVIGNIAKEITLFSETKNVSKKMNLKAFLWNAIWTKRLFLYHSTFAFSISLFPEAELCCFFSKVSKRDSASLRSIFESDLHFLSCQARSHHLPLTKLLIWIAFCRVVADIPKFSGIFLQFFLSMSLYL